MDGKFFVNFEKIFVYQEHNILSCTPVKSCNDITRRVLSDLDKSGNLLHGQRRKSELSSHMHNMQKHHTKEVYCVLTNLCACIMTS
jgi:hypothetical protein